MRGPVRTTAVVLGVVLPLVLGSCGGRAPAPSSTASSSRSTPTSSPPSTPSASPSTSRTDSAVDAALARLDPRQRVAQLFVVGVPVAHLADGDELVRQGVGGVFLAGRSSASTGELAAVTGRWSGEAPGPRPWVAADQEGGQVQTLKGPGFALLPSADDQGRLPPPQLAALADGMGAALGSAGVSLDLAPVADVVPAGTEHANAPIGFFDRQYGSTPQQVQSAAGAVVDGLAAHRVTAAIKHFPGLGRATGNTDTTAGVTDSVTSADDPQVAVFGALAGRPAAPMVMVSLAVYPRIDGAQPAAFSPAVVTDLLRGRLGFHGPVISDDLGQAKAVASVLPGDRAVRFLAAGGTLVLTVVTAQFGPMLDAVTARAAADPAFAARVDAAVRTALLAKERAGLLGG